MSTFQQLIDAQLGLPEHQRLRVENIRRIEQHTGRPLIVYAADWVTPSKRRTEGFLDHVGLDYNDVLPFRELISGANNGLLDVLLHSPGGLGEAAERIVNLLRSRFRDVRFLVPHSAMSAATMLCFSGNSVGLGDTSALGPIDPQVNGVPARAIKKGFERVRRAVGKSPSAIGPYLPMLQKYDLYTFEVCDNAERLARKLAREWLSTYMFEADKAAHAKVRRIVGFFASHDKHLSHARSIDVDQCIHVGLKVHDLRQDCVLGDLVWELWQRVEFFFGAVPQSIKLFENSRGVSFMRMMLQQAIVQLPSLLPVIPPPAPPGEALAAPPD